MIVDGKKIAAEIEVKLKKEIDQLLPLKVVAITLVENKITETYLKLKEKLAIRLGVDFNIFNYEANLTTKELVSEIIRLNNDASVSGIVVQLPLPHSIDLDEVVAAISPAKDIDALNPETGLNNPVVGAVSEILKQIKVRIEGKKILVLGSGRLVGKPVALWFAKQGYEVDMVNIKTQASKVKDLLLEADIIVSGIGNPSFIKPSFIKEGVVLIDAGTSEDGGKVVGDADPSCASKAGFITLVPGGVGPITLVKLFENLLTLSYKYKD